jgi:hypothetical protein
MTADRRNQLELILNNLRGLPGVSGVESDDFDSTSVNVFISLLGTRHKLAVGLRRMKDAIKRTCLCNFLSQPIPQYSWAGRGFKPWHDGYDQLLIKIEVFV